MDLSAAAATMGIPEGTMKARLSRGRALLRQRFPKLQESLPDPPGLSSKRKIETAKGDRQ
jgi:hypothetical protein